MPRDSAGEFPEGDPVKTLEKTRKALKKLKDDKGSLSERLDLVMTNNFRFADLVLLLEGKVKALTEENAKVYNYSYDKGGWIEKGAAVPSRLRIKRRGASVRKINSQLEEILRLIKQHRSRE